MFFCINLGELQLNLRIEYANLREDGPVNEWCSIVIEVLNDDNTIYYKRGELMLYYEVDRLKKNLRRLLTGKPIIDDFNFAKPGIGIYYGPCQESEYILLFILLNFIGGSSLDLCLCREQIEALYFYLLYVSNMSNDTTVFSKFIVDDIFTVRREDDNEVLDYDYYDCLYEPDEDIRRRRDGEYIYLSCCYNPEDCSPTYYYRTDDDTIQEEDFVIVPVGRNNREVKVWVVEKQYFTKENLPLPLEKTKEVLRKAEKNLTDKQSDLNFERIDTPLGLIKIYANNTEIEYIFTELPKEKLYKDVEKVFSIDISISDFSKGTTVKIALDTKASNSYEESGETLYIKSFEKDDIKLSIGFYDKYENSNDPLYELHSFSKNSLSVIINKSNARDILKFRIAWIRPFNEDNEMQTWFAADPS